MTRYCTLINLQNLKLKASFFLLLILLDHQGKQLVFINKNNPEIDVTGKVPREDLYVIIAEYYQPNHPEVTVSF